MQHRLVPLADLAAELNRLCQTQRTGVLRIVTDKNHAASFGLVAGRIVNVRYRIKRNSDALLLLKQVETGQFSFAEGENADDESAALPPTEEILGQFGQYGVPVGTALEPNPAPKPPSEAAVTLSPSARAVLEAALAEHIGPIASIVCRSALAKASSLPEAITTMAERIPNPERARQFEQEVRGRLA